MRCWLLLLCCLTWPARSWGSEQVFATAGQSDSLEKRDTSARVAALGGNGASLEEGADSMLSNPAALARSEGLSMGLHHLSWLAGIDQEVATAAGHLGRSAWGLELGLVNYGSFDAVDELGQPQGTVSAEDYNLSVGGAQAVGAGLSIGGSLRYNRQTLAGEALTQGSVDLGLHWDGGRWRAGLLFANVASTLLDGSRGPSALRAEFSGDLLSHPTTLRAYAGFSAEQGGYSRGQVGVEDEIYGSLTLRAGYEALAGDSLVAGFSGATFGLGFAMGPITLDYAYLPFGDLGAGQRLSVTWHLAKAPATEESAEAQAAPPAPPSPPVLASPPVAESVETGAKGEALQHARQLEDSGHWDQAVAVHQWLLGIDPADPLVWRSLGDLQYRTGRKAEAIQSYDQAFQHGLINPLLQTWLAKYRSQP